MRHFFSRLLGHRESTDAPKSAPRLKSARFPRALYAIGDVHGRLDLLAALEEKIARHSGGPDSEIWVVLLGDMIDRGPASAQVIDHVTTPSKWGFRRLCLSGNHEQAMLEAFEGPEGFEWWCRYGGLDTLSSYGISVTQLDPGARSWETNRAVLESYVPDSHIEFLAGLPVMIEVPGYVLVHAGVRPGVALAEQTDADLRWFRYPSDERATGSGPCVVHGHSVVAQPLVSPGRIAIDTGAYQTGRLTAVCLRPDQDPIIIEQSGPGSPL